jgi:hypothetical protein
VRTRTGVIATLLTLAVVDVAVPLATASPANDNRLVIGIKLTFDTSTHAAGSFAACCAVNDAGSAQANILQFTPTSGDEASFKATNTYTGHNGTFEILLDGVTGPLSSPHHIARAHWTVIGGTGAYANLHGEGQLTAVTDDTDGSLAAIAAGEGHSG